MTDEELIRTILSDRAATPREKILARRMSMLLHAFDELEDLFGEETLTEGRVLQ